MTVKVLFFAYHFPPMGGGGVQRTAKFAKYLTGLGIDVVVVTGPALTPERWIDDSLAADVPEQVEVFRPTTQPPNDYRSTRLGRLLGQGGATAEWWAAVIADLGTRVARSEHPDVIVATVPPYETLGPALDVGQRLSIPVIADMRDPWVLDEGKAYPSAFQRAQDRRKMVGLLKRAAMVVMNTPEAGRAAEQLFDGSVPLTVITNGFDPDDFRTPAKWAPCRDLTIVHAGGLHLRLAEAADKWSALRRLVRSYEWPIDVRGRSHFYLVRALEELRKRAPELASRTRLQLVGSLDPDDIAYVKASPAADMINTSGYAPHGESISAVCTADLLFLPLHGLPGGHRSRIVPGKTYEYLASGRPILAAVPDGDAADFVRDANAGHVVEPSDVSSMLDVIVLAHERSTPTRSMEPSVERFSRLELAAQLSQLLGIVVGARHVAS